MPQHQPADPLHDLRERVRETAEATERLAADAARARAAQDEGRVPPAGWATEQERASVRDELENVAALLRTLRALVPAELEQQVAEVLRQVLLLLRALLDWWVARLDEVAAPERAAAATPPPRKARDIPVT